MALFKPSRFANSGAPLPDGIDFEKAVARASADVTPGTFHPTDADQPRSATTINELHGQIGLLISTFQTAERRLPGPDDSEFWSAYRTLVQRFNDNYAPEGPAGSVE